MESDEIKSRKRLLIIKERNYKKLSFKVEYKIDDNFYDEKIKEIVIF